MAVDSKEDFIQMPMVAEPAFSSLQLADIICAKLLTPQPDGFVRDEDASFRQKILDVSEAEAETMVGPDRITNDLGRTVSRRREQRHAVREMRVDPSKSPCWGRFQTAISCYGLRAAVVNVMVKRRGIDHVMWG